MKCQKTTCTYKPLFKYNGNEGLVEKKERKINIGNLCEWCNKEKRTFKALCYKCDKWRIKNYPEEDNEKKFTT